MNTCPIRRTLQHNLHLKKSKHYRSSCLKPYTVLKRSRCCNFILPNFISFTGIPKSSGLEQPSHIKKHLRVLYVEEREKNNIKPYEIEMLCESDMPPRGLIKKREDSQAPFPTQTQYLTCALFCLISAISTQIIRQDKHVPLTTCIPPLNEDKRQTDYKVQLTKQQQLQQKQS